MLRILNSMRRALAVRYQNIGTTGGGIFLVLSSLPLLLLLLAMSTVFLFDNDRRDSLYRPGLHSWNTAFYLTKATNLSPEHNFLRFSHRSMDADGVPIYEPYNRFPIGGYALIKLVILPFGDDLAAKIYAVRTMFLLFFAGSAALAYLSLCRLIANRWIALTATLLAFSTYYLLYYNDMPATETGLSLFGVLLTFHGMVLFVQEARFRQLLIKACAALLLGWHVAALLVPFVVLGMLGELNRARRLPDPPSLAGRIKVCVSAPPFSRYMTLAVVTLLFCMALVSFNLGSEYRAFDGDVPLTELPTVKSMIYRLGADDEFNERHAGQLEWGNFLTNQFYRVARATLPFNVSPFDNHSVIEDKDDLGVIVGALASGVAVIGLLFVRHKMLLATLVSVGFCWSLPMRHNTAFHDFETVFYVGVPLVLFSMGLSCVRGLFGGRLLVGLSAAALLVFVLSGSQMARFGQDKQASEFQEAIAADFERIRTIAEAGQGVFVAEPYSFLAGIGGIAAYYYYLTGRVIGHSWRNLPDDLPYDLFISRQRIDIPALLTPENKQIFLYGRSDYLAQMDEIIRKSELVIRFDGYFDVYRSGNRLIYLWNIGEDRAAQLSSPDIPIVGKPFAVRLSSAVRRAGFTDRSAWQWQRGSDAEGWTDVSDSLKPTYLYTPTTTDAGYQLRAYVHYTDRLGNRVKAMTLPSLPVQPGSATYMGFFLHLIPVDMDDLPDDRKRHGFDNLDFRFSDYRMRLTERPIAVRYLPDYPIASIRTGQFTDEGRVWEAEARFHK